MVRQTKTRRGLSWLILIVALALTDAAVDCNKRVKLNPQTKKNCCLSPSLKLDAYKDQCGKYQKSASLMAPCLLECVFNSTNAMTGNTLNINNLRSMVTKFLGNNQNFTETYVNGFQNCASSVEDWTKLRLRLQPMSESCSMVPIYLGMCASRYVFAHCPSASWSNTKSCNDARDYTLNCKEKEGKGRHPMRF